MDSGWSVRFETWNSHDGEKTGMTIFTPTGKRVLHTANTGFSVDERGAEEALVVAMGLAESIFVMDENGEEQW